MNKLLFLIFILLLTKLTVFSQSSSHDLSWINNSIQYDLFLEAPDVSQLFSSGSITISKYSVEVSVSQEKMETLKDISYTEWKNLLLSENSDFATNLLLYDYFDKDAWLLLNTSRAEWTELHKDEEVKSWLKFLKDNIDK